VSLRKGKEIRKISSSCCFPAAMQQPVAALLQYNVGKALNPVRIALLYSCDYIVSHNQCIYFRSAHVTYKHTSKCYFATLNRTSTCPCRSCTVGVSTFGAQPLQISSLPLLCQRSAMQRRIQDPAARAQAVIVSAKQCLVRIDQCFHDMSLLPMISFSLESSFVIGI
jgi:hypothetical protein